MKEAKPILVIVAAAAVLVLVFLILKGGSTETVLSPAVQLPPPGTVASTGDPIAVVMSMHEDHKTSLLGLVRVETHYIVGVQFYAPPECSTSIADGDPWPAATAECQTDVPVTGVISGTGVAATGETIVLVDTEVTGECFDMLYPNDIWPPELLACEQPSSG